MDKENLYVVRDSEGLPTLIRESTLKHFNLPLRNQRVPNSVQDQLMIYQSIKGIAEAKRELGIDEASDSKK